MAKGLEETAVLDLASPPSGAPLVSALGDIGGFQHADLDAVPANFHDTPSLGSNTSLDFAELNPSVFARVGNGDRRRTSASPPTAAGTGTRARNRPG